jgi:hypothetical protein
MTAGAETLSPGDRALLERLADRIVELRLEVPAILTLESGRPLSLLASQTLIFFEPIVQALFPLGDYRRFAKLIENREAIEALTNLIERRAEAAHDARRAARRKPR